MAQPVNTLDSYDLSDIFEDLINKIYDVSPSDAPFFSRAKKIKASNTYKEWVKDSIRASKDNAHPEGGETVASARTATTRLGNYTQIMKEAVNIPGTDVALDKAGRGKQMAYEMMKLGKEMRIDVERALFANQARDAGTGTGIRRMAGAPAWFITNVDMGTGAAADPTGDGTDARTDGTVRAFSQTVFDSLMQEIWTNSSTPSEAYSVFLRPKQMNIALDFVGNNAQRSTVVVNRTGKKMVSNDIDVYITPWGEVEFVMSRECRERDVFVMCMEHWAVAEARPFTQKELPAIGDYESRQIAWEGTLCALNEASSGIAADCT